MPNKESLSFRDAIDEALAHEEELASLSNSRPNLPSAIFDTPEMQGIKATLVMWANWPTNPLPPDEKLRVLGTLPESVIEWALS